MNEFTVGPASAGERLDVVLASALGVSRNQAVGRIAAGDVTVDGAVVGKQHRLRDGAQVRVRVPEVVEPAPAPALPPIRYQDEHLVVLAKPPGLVVHPGPGHTDDTLVHALLTAGIPLAPAAGEARPGIVHRLDRDTSGLLVVASTDAAYTALVEAMADRRVQRRYLALVVGQPADPRGRIDAPIGRDPASRTRFGVVLGGRPAVTRYRTLASGAAPTQTEVPVSLLACTLETGRTHQIRVHLTALGHPVVGDGTYGPRRAVATALGTKRPLLHAAVLRFTHPVTGTEVVVEEPAPQDLVEAGRRSGIAVPDVLPDDGSG